MICQVHTSPASTHCGLSKKINMLEKAQGLQDKLADRGRKLFVFVFECVVYKDPNAPNESSMADDAITWGQYRWSRISGLNLRDLHSVVICQWALLTYPPNPK